MKPSFLSEPEEGRSGKITRSIYAGDKYMQVTFHSITWREGIIKSLEKADAGSREAAEQAVVKWVQEGTR